MKQIVKGKILVGIALGMLSTQQSMAQYTLTGQVRTRTEYRNGLADLVPSGAKPSLFNSQRTSIIFGYKWDRLTFGANLRDVRVWGQDASSINNADGNKLYLHEGWGEFVLANIADTTIKFKALNNLSVKVGRQELVYDDARLLGNLDWLQQGRRHDIAVIKGMHKGYQFDLGFAFNQNTDAFNKVGTDYTPLNTPNPFYATTSKGVVVPVPAGTIPLAYNSAPTASTNAASAQYKAMQFLYLSKKYGQTKISFLGLKDDFNKYDRDTIYGKFKSPEAANGFIIGNKFNNQAGLNSRQTAGFNVNTMVGNASGAGKLAIQAFGYYQWGKNRAGVKMKAFSYGANVQYQYGKFSVGPGYEVMSGNSRTTSIALEDNRFDPLYGTPHKFWGYMDFFYVGTGSPVGGLQNWFFKTKYTAKDLMITLDAHYFLTQKTMNNPWIKSATDPDPIIRALGTEIDLVANYNLNKFTNIEAGASVMFGSDALAVSKGKAKADYQQEGYWGYLQLNIRPDFLYVKPVAIKQ
jgi:hypothetical protein